MTRHLLIAASACVMLATPATGQTGRGALLAGIQAHDVADFETAVSLLRRGLDPTFGSRDSLWVLGLHKLVDALNELDRAQVAAVWVRWALRADPEIEIDSVRFPPAVKRLFDAARSVVERPGSDTASVEVSWVWAPAGHAGTRGAIELRKKEFSLTGRIAGGASLVPETTTVLPPGTYTVLASADGYRASRVTVDVLPGVTTVLDFQLQRASGFLYVASRPWAEVRVNGEPVGYTLLVGHRLPEGTHRIRLARQGYVPFDTVITVRHDERIRLGRIELSARRPE